MPRIAVIYYSKYGSTQKYAEWIAEEVEGDLLDAHRCKYRDLAPYDIIVYGGGIYSGGIKGVDLITKNWNKGLSEKPVFVFAVGIATGIEANRKQCMDVNFEQRLINWVSGEDAESVGEEGGTSLKELLSMKMMPVKCFFFPGAFDPKAIKSLDKGIIKITRKMMGDVSGNEESALVAGYIDNGCDLVDESAIDQLVAAVKESAKRLEEELQVDANV